tara:strand:- start:10855 stop:11097 length:243 start_codon:yes stop_codon:yes gene_type:complete
MSKIFNHNGVKIDIRGENSLYVDIKGQTIYIDTSISNELIVTSWNNCKESKSDFTADWDIIQKLDEDKLVLYTELESEVK